MGADVHAFIEYTDKNYEDPRNLCEVKIERNYWLFILMAGVRGNSIQGHEQIVKRKGLPSKTSWQIKNKAYLFIVDDPKNVQEGYCTKTEASQWAKEGRKYIEGKRRIEHPDWHSHTWLNLKEVEKLIETYSKLEDKIYEYVSKGSTPPTGFIKKNLDKTDAEIDIYSKVVPVSIPNELLAIRGAMKALDEQGCKPKLVLWWDN